jgi:hypothetical protein
VVFEEEVEVLEVLDGEDGKVVEAVVDMVSV